MHRRPTNLRFPFPKGHPLRDEYYQKLVSKLPCNKVAGAAPPREPRKLRAGQAPSAGWRRSQQRFAEYFLSVYMPWEVEARPGKPLEQVYPSEAGPGLRMGTDCSSRPELSPNALRAWMSMLRSQAAVPKENMATCAVDGRT